MAIQHPFEEGRRDAGMLAVYAADLGADLPRERPRQHAQHLDNGRKTGTGRRREGGRPAGRRVLRERLKHYQGLVRTTEEEARNAFASELHRKRRSHRPVRGVLPAEYEWPREQGSHVDRIERGPTGCVGPVDRGCSTSGAPERRRFECSLEGGAARHGKQLRARTPRTRSTFAVTAAHEEGALGASRWGA